MRAKVNALALEGIYKAYHTGALDVQVLQGIDLTIKKGEFASIMGPSGSGKSTLMHMAGALDVPTRGKVIVDGQDTSRMDPDELADLRGRKIGFVFQKFNLVHSLTAAENVEIPLMFQSVEKTERKKRVNDLLGRVGLSHRVNHRPGELSGGEQQRVPVTLTFDDTGSAKYTQKSEIGILLGAALSKVAEIAIQQAAFDNFHASLGLELVAGARWFSFVVGGLSGLLPARVAAQLNPVDALRYE